MPTSVVIGIIVFLSFVAGALLERQLAQPGALIVMPAASMDCEPIIEPQDSPGALDTPFQRARLESDWLDRPSHQDDGQDRGLLAGQDFAAIVIVGSLNRLGDESPRQDVFTSQDLFTSNGWEQRIDRAARALEARNGQIRGSR